MKASMKSFILIAAALTLFSCNGKNRTQGLKKMDEKTDKGTFIISAPVVEKTFINNGGKIEKFTDYYVQRSIQDYFIKFCESGITRKELEKVLSLQKDSLIKTLTMEVEIKKGFWDSCGSELVQSRTGEYIIIHRILKDR